MLSQVQLHRCGYMCSVVQMHDVARGYRASCTVDRDHSSLQEEAHVLQMWYVNLTLFVSQTESQPRILSIIETGQ